MTADPSAVHPTMGEALAEARTLANARRQELAA